MFLIWFGFAAATAAAVDSRVHAWPILTTFYHPPLDLYLRFHVFKLPHPYTCQEMSSPPFFVFFFNLVFWFLLSALLTCFVSFFPFCFLSAIQYLQMKWPLLDVQPGSLQSRQALKDARSPSPAHIVVSNTPLGPLSLSSLIHDWRSWTETNPWTWIRIAVCIYP